jgi:hypothetical protein
MVHGDGRRGGLRQRESALRGRLRGWRWRDVFLNSDDVQCISDGLSLAVGRVLARAILGRVDSHGRALVVLLLGQGRLAIQVRRDRAAMRPRLSGRAQELLQRHVLEGTQYRLLHRGR